MGVFFKRSRAANSAVCCRILPNFKLVRDIMVVLHTCKNEEDPIKNEGPRVLTSLLFDFLVAQVQLTPKSVVEFRRNSNSSKLFIVVLVTCKNDKHPIKNKGSRELTRFSPLKVYGSFFSNAQGQLTPQSVVESCRISNSSEILWLSSIPARMKKIRSK